MAVNKFAGYQDNAIAVCLMKRRRVVVSLFSGEPRVTRRNGEGAEWLLTLLGCVVEMKRNDLFTSTTLQATRTKKSADLKRRTEQSATETDA